MKSVALRDELIGTWKLVSYVETPVDGSSQRFPLGEKPEGMLLYAPDGYMSAQLMRPGRRKFFSGDMFKGALEEYADEAIGYLAYSGPFHVDEVTSTLTHSITVSLFPGWLGQTQPRLAPQGASAKHRDPRPCSGRQERPARSTTEWPAARGLAAALPSDAPRWRTSHLGGCCRGVRR